MSHGVGVLPVAGLRILDNPGHRIRVAQSRLVGPAAQRDEVGAEVSEAVFRAPVFDDVGRSPQIPCVGPLVEAMADACELDDRLGGELGETILELMRDVVALAACSLARL